jgi:hypothetical protein
VDILINWLILFINWCQSFKPMVIGNYFNNECGFGAGWWGAGYRLFWQVWIIFSPWQQPTPRLES